MFRSEIGAFDESTGPICTTAARMRGMRPILAFVFLLSVGVPAQAQWWQVQTSGIDTNLRGVSAKFNEGSSPPGLHYFVWASGSNGVILRSTDDGKTWKQ